MHEAIAAIQSVLGVRGGFDPATDHRTFTIVASDYVGLVLLRPLVKHLAARPRVRLVVRPVLSPDFLTQLRRDQIDLALVPQELMPERVGLPQEELFRDRYVCAVDAGNEAIGDALSVGEFTRLPPGQQRWPAPALGQRQLGSLRLFPAAEISTQTSLLAPFLLAGTDMITLVLERLGPRLQDAAGIRLVEPPVPLQTITETMYWIPAARTSPGHRWLREQVLRTAREL